MKDAKRRRFEIRWNDEDLWHLVDKATGQVYGDMRYFVNKEKLKTKARQVVSTLAPSELVVRNQDGKVAGGHHGRQVYSAKR